MIPTPPRADPANVLDGHITDLAGLISLALALVTVFTTVRATRAVARKGQEGLTRDVMLGELVLDIGLLILTVGVILAATPLFVGAIEYLSIGTQRGALRLTFVVVWLLLVGLAAWQVAILKSTAATTASAWSTRVQRPT